MEELREKDPTLVRQISEHKDEFIKFLNSMPDQPPGNPTGEISQNENDLNEIEENKAVEKLAEFINCNKNTALKAYIKCEKNEHEAAY
jgi:hypothetical protein